MKVKTNQLTGTALDWAVAKCEGVKVEHVDDGITECLLIPPSGGGRYSPSTNWSQGGPIIEEWKIAIDFDQDTPEYWNASIEGMPFYFSGPTPLVVAMRCYVSHKLGEEIEVPDELLKT